ncbi:hypothetical protein ACFVT2_18440 [Streptomyces sp. NPDC058000]|uniref:hypothetical protein n=1 Tax=Streptomyces sp. NPDC058000 TaxID=3346299 RepID=UPI0036DFAD77
MDGRPLTATVEEAVSMVSLIVEELEAAARIDPRCGKVPGKRQVEQLHRDAARGSAARTLAHQTSRRAMGRLAGQCDGCRGLCDLVNEAHPISFPTKELPGFPPAVCRTGSSTLLRLAVRYDWCR